MHLYNIRIHDSPESWSCACLLQSFPFVLHLVLKRLKGSLTEHQPQLYQVLEEGKRLLLSVGCLDLENQLTQLGEHWLSSTTKVNKELHRLDSTLKHWSR